jgi:hypothetical protein
MHRCPNLRRRACGTLQRRSVQSSGCQPAARCCFSWWCKCNNLKWLYVWYTACSPMFGVWVRCKFVDRLFWTSNRRHSPPPLLFDQRPSLPSHAIEKQDSLKSASLTSKGR